MARYVAIWTLVTLVLSVASTPLSGKDDAGSTRTISVSLYSELERLARLVDISYCIGNTGISEPFDCLSRCDEFPHVKLVTTWDTGVLMSDSCGYIAVDEGQSSDDGEGGGGPPAILVAFRGTLSITNTVVDLGTVPQEYVPYPSPPGNGDGPECTNCTVHMGFMQSWDMARRWVVPELIRLRTEHPDYPIHLAGHSLGGAVACLAALELRVSLGWDNVVVTTYGQPRVGNGGLARFIDRVFDLDHDARKPVDDDPPSHQYRRVTHINDPVPVLPPDEWSYQSHAGEIFIAKEALSPSETDVRVCSGDEDERCSAGGSGFTRFTLWRLFTAHRDYFWRLGLCAPGGDSGWLPGVGGYHHDGDDGVDEL
ncbi:Lipase (class 3) [Geosmithia morbida]|uniref:Lipase (Class 3) n=1 Tax=Geosmithia morbida TaxID=1094350 RepID=A0A9P4YX01_9HYPO|nr:Lipase (class 3) [Geosmithia morbida]KAF4122579.1 Lipase (class 3) [Geosmithia morbida]